jgi:hypothetical protein
LQYLELKYPQMPLLPADVDGKIAARRIEVLCDGVCDAVVLPFFDRMRLDGARSPERLARQLRKIDGGVREMAHLIGTKTFAVGNEIRLAQPISEAGHLRHVASRNRQPQSNWPITRWGNWPALIFRGRLIELPSDPIASLPGEKNESGDQADHDKHPVLASEAQKSKMLNKKLHRSRPHSCAG